MIPSIFFQNKQEVPAAFFKAQNPTFLASKTELAAEVVFDEQDDLGFYVSFFVSVRPGCVFTDEGGDIFY